MIRIRIPNFPRKVEISKARKTKFFKPTDELPEKYKHTQYEWRKKGKFIYLYDKAYDEFVVKNPKAAGTPRYAYVSGNELYARMHERVRMKIVGAVKDSFKNAIQGVVKNKEELLKTLSFPISVSMEIQTPFDYSNWDVDNLWIYHKCFLDSLRDLEILDDDNILFVREAGAVKFTPITPDETPTMIFTLLNAEPYPSATETIEVVEDFVEKPGLMIISPDGKKATISVGRKKVIFGAAKDAIRRLHYYCMNYNRSISISRSLHEKYKNFFEDFPKSNIKIIFKA